MNERLKNYWYVISQSSELKSEPLHRVIFNRDIVIFRDDQGKVGALQDRCPHRNVALSEGKVCGDYLQCPYHGWKFDRGGVCRSIPSNLKNDSIPQTSSVKAYAVVEQDDLIWIYTGDGDVRELPMRLPYYKSKEWKNFRYVIDIDCSVDYVIENFVDCAHTGFVHEGLFRKGAKQLVDVSIKNSETGVMITTLEKQSFDGILSKLLGVGNKKVCHTDHFILPSIIQVDYYFGSKHTNTTTMCTPLSDQKTRIYVQANLNLGWASFFMKPFIRRLGKKIMAQDKAILENQFSRVQKYGENFTSTQADLASLWVRKLRRGLVQKECQFRVKEKDYQFYL